MKIGIWQDGSWRWDDDITPEYIAWWGEPRLIVRVSLDVNATEQELNEFAKNALQEYL